MSFRYKGKDRLVGNVDEVFCDFEVIKKSKADLVLGIPWLCLCEAEIDVERGGIRIYGDFIPFCKYSIEAKISSNTDSESETDDPFRVNSSESSSSDFEMYEEIPEILGKYIHPKKKSIYDKRSTR
jgi:hypothetical protein